MNKICFTLPNLLSSQECEQLIHRAEDGLYLSMKGDYPASYRDNDRLTSLDPSLAQVIGKRLAKHVPQVIQEGKITWTFDSVNPKFRGCRYRDGMKFTRHRDGTYSPEPGKQSLLTVMLYLNDSSEFEGGATRFFEDRFVQQSEREIKPQTGLAIIFSHDYWHDGEAVLKGTKHILRSDLVYRASVTEPNKHRGYVWDITELEDGTLVTGSRDRTIRLWNDGISTLSLEAHESSVTCLAPSEGGFMSGGRDRFLYSWTQKGDAVQREAGWLAHNGAVLQILNLADRTILSSGADGMVRHWRGDGSLLREWSLGSWPWALRALQENRVLVGSEVGQIWDIDLLKDELNLKYEIDCPILALAQSPDRIYLACADGHLRVLSAEYELLSSLPGHRGPITSVETLPDGRVVTGAEDDGVRIWQGNHSELLTEHKDFVRALCVTRNGFVASVSYDGSLQLSKPSAILRRERAAKPACVRSGTAQASW